tara:strand:+ start:1388 stop:1744 length:357 start_codon:yes stop_codon:yes gene_type:complete
MMDKSILNKIEDLIKDKKINQAQIEISKLGPEFHKDIEYLFLRGKIFYINKLYYQALDALLIATEFGEDNKVYDLISKIYKILGNEDLSKKITNLDTRLKAINTLKKEVTGISQKEES